ncbi:hypothetical protein [Ornithinimicrobium sp. W1665]|uniref:hypothetical protein n=1 Tax=Ornithinimicrobium sp. W1665 TaxID=3416666 RepID=UPI003D6A6AE4
MHLVLPSDGGGFARGSEQRGQLGVVGGHDHVDPRVLHGTDDEGDLRTQAVQLRAGARAVDQHGHAERDAGGRGPQLLVRGGQHDHRGLVEEVGDRRVGQGRGVVVPGLVVPVAPVCRRPPRPRCPRPPRRR